VKHRRQFLILSLCNNRNLAHVEVNATRTVKQKYKKKQKNDEEKVMYAV
jgi:hypothetical protein